MLTDLSWLVGLICRGTRASQGELVIHSNFNSTSLHHRVDHI